MENPFDQEASDFFESQAIEQEVKQEVGRIREEVELVLHDRNIAYDRAELDFHRHIIKVDVENDDTVFYATGVFAWLDALTKYSNVDRLITVFADIVPSDTNRELSKIWSVPDAQVSQALASIDPEITGRKMSDDEVRFVSMARTVAETKLTLLAMEREAVVNSLAEAVHSVRLKVASIQKQIEEEGVVYSGISVEEYMGESKKLLQAQFLVSHPSYEGLGEALSDLLGGGEPLDLVNEAQIFIGFAESAREKSKLTSDLVNETVISSKPSLLKSALTRMEGDSPAKKNQKANLYITLNKLLIKTDSVNSWNPGPDLYRQAQELGVGSDEIDAFAELIILKRQ